jgi:hypothetical protein
MTKPDAINALDDSLIDRIVDGALTPAELRSALERIDSENDGWKRCALAFLEAQCWHNSLRALDVPTTSPLANQFVPPGFAARTSTGPRHWMRGPIAAGIIAASFALGWSKRIRTHGRVILNPERFTPTSQVIFSRPISPRGGQARRDLCRRRMKLSGGLGNCISAREAPRLTCQSWPARESTNSGSGINRRRLRSTARLPCSAGATMSTSGGNSSRPSWTTAGA